MDFTWISNLYSQYFRRGTIIARNCYEPIFGKTSDTWHLGGYLHQSYNWLSLTELEAGGSEGWNRMLLFDCMPTFTQCNQALRSTTTHGRE
jgi:hypothetical protein